MEQSTGGKAKAQTHAGTDLVMFLRKLGEAYQLQADYRCREAIAAYKALPVIHQKTAWVQSQIARCHFELGDYEDAAKGYEMVQQMQPYRLEGMEIYSTCLWHLKKQYELTYLSQTTHEMNKHAPETWCVLGNCFSLQNEHEKALEYFQTAIKQDSYFAYAHTLSGHEYVEIEDFEKARKAYTEALKKDERHFRALWGLGNVAQKQEKYQDAKNHYENAIKVNPHSPMLLMYLGSTLHNMNQPEQSLEVFSRAEALDPKNKLIMY